MCALNFLVFFFQPSIISELVKLISCRQIGNKRYVMADINFECYDNEHKTYILSLALPVLLIWGVYFTIYYLQFLRKNV